MRTELDVVRLVKSLRNLQILIRQATDRDTRIASKTKGYNVIDLSDLEEPASENSDEHSEFIEDIKEEVSVEMNS